MKLHLKTEVVITCWLFVNDAHLGQKQMNMKYLFNGDWQGKPNEPAPLSLYSP